MKSSIAKRVFKRLLNRNRKWLQSQGVSTKKYGHFKINISPNWSNLDVQAARSVTKSLKI